MPAAAFLLPALLWGTRRGSWGAVFPLKPVPFPVLLRAAALAAGASLAALAAAALLTRLFPSSGEEEAALRRLIQSVPPGEALLLFALWPALCEEALFRGALLDGLRPFPPAAACLLSGMVFGLFHGSLFRFLPVALLGAALAAVVLRTGNWALAVLFHALHNGAILLSAAPPGAGEPPFLLPALLGVLLGFWGLGPYPRKRMGGKGEAVKEEEPPSLPS